MQSSRDPGSFCLVGLGILHWILCVQLVDGGGEGVEDCVGGFYGPSLERTYTTFLHNPLAALNTKGD